MNFRKLFYNKFSREEQVLVKRPQYILGSIILLGLFFYFWVRAFGPDVFEWPPIKDVISIIAGGCISVFIMWLLFRAFGVRSKSMLFLLVFAAAWTTIFGLLTIGQKRSSINWEYLVWAILIFLGWILCSNSIKGHLSKTTDSYKQKGAEPGN